MNEEHIGARIERKVRERGLTNTEFAKAIYCMNKAVKFVDPVREDIRE
jgi:truncated hemoglobin YjbI